MGNVAKTVLVVPKGQTKKGYQGEAKPANKLEQQELYVLVPVKPGQKWRKFSLVHKSACQKRPQYNSKDRLDNPFE